MRPHAFCKQSAVPANVGFGPARIIVLSRKLSPQLLLETARGHWQIENSPHWQLDVSFGEDAARNRKDNGPASIAVIRRRALDIARLDQSKGSLTAKLRRARCQTFA